MGRYRKVDVSMWLDARFQSLTPIQPSGQALWIYLLTNPDTTAIPGLYRAGELQMAEALGWQPKAFREAFGEAANQGMVKADWKARVIWIPGAIRYNKPESPNVVRGWLKHLDDIPECNLKNEAIQSIKAYLEGLGEAFGEPWPQASPNQEQEQEQEQDKEKAPRKTKSQIKPAVIPDTLNGAAWNEWQAYRTQIKKPIKPASMAKAMKDMAKLGTPQEQQAAVDHSMANGYQGLYPPKTNNGGNNGKRESNITRALRERAEELRLAERQGTTGAESAVELLPRRATGPDR